MRSLPIQERITLTGTLAVFALVVSNKVFSGQYMLWLVVMVAALAGWSRLEAHVGVCLTVATMMTHAVFPLLYVPLTHGDLAPLLLLTARDVLLIYMMGRLLARLVRGSPTTSRIRSTPLERSVEPVR